MSAILNNKLEAVIYSVAKTAQLALEYGDESTTDKRLYEKIIFEIATIASNAKVVDECINESKNAQSVVEFEEMYKQYKDHKSGVNVRSCEHYKNWIRKIYEIIDVGNSRNNENLIQDDDFEMTGEINDIDPITKKRMQNPLKNKVCGHYYEKDSILETISQNQRYKCPIVGCTNKEIIRKTGLEEDLSFKLKLARTLTSN